MWSILHTIDFPPSGEKVGNSPLSQFFIFPHFPTKSGEFPTKVGKFTFRIVESGNKCIPDLAKGIFTSGQILKKIPGSGDPEIAPKWAPLKGQKAPKPVEFIAFRTPGLPKEGSFPEPFLGADLYCLKGILKQIRVWESGEILRESGGISEGESGESPTKSGEMKWGNMRQEKWGNVNGMAPISCIFYIPYEL